MSTLYILSKTDKDKVLIVNVIARDFQEALSLLRKDGHDADKFSLEVLYELNAHSYKVNPGYIDYSVEFDFNEENKQ